MQITHRLRSMKLWGMGLGLVIALGFTSMAQAWGGPYGPVSYRGCDSCVVGYKVKYYRHYNRCVRPYCNTCYTCRTCCNTCNTCGNGYGYGYRYY